ncbi:hypothetical protein AKJ16_DCAP21013 [Drosera capensis]
MSLTGRLKINVDVAMKVEGVASTGVVLRDHNGQIIATSGQNLRVPVTSMTGKTIANRSGLEWRVLIKAALRRRSASKEIISAEQSSPLPPKASTSSYPAAELLARRYRLSQRYLLFLCRLDSPPSTNNTCFTHHSSLDHTVRSIASNSAWLPPSRFLLNLSLVLGL